MNEEERATRRREQTRRRVARWRTNNHATTLARQRQYNAAWRARKRAERESQDSPRDASEGGKQA